MKFLRVLHCASIAVAAIGSARIAAAEVDFVKEIQPIFEKSCYSCHGEKMQMGGLRLDSKSVAAKEINAGKAAESALFLRITATSDQTRMPMGAKPLDGSEITLIRQWIDQGASWPDGPIAKSAEAKKHWAYVAPTRPELPSVSNTKWSTNPIDRFILARLEQEKLRPAPEADKATLLRRLSLDLIGLPPTPEETEAFLKDKSRGAYEKQVDRLLQSPHYGERWGRVWLDAARYADSDGYEKDKSRQVWFYRDWVIQAMNRDMPYDRFVIEQVAGDLLPNATQDQKVATGFLRNSMINEEGGVDPEQFRMEAMFDRMDVIGKSVLGVTIQCAQCHNHKFDPLKQEEYYRMFAFLNDSHEGNVAVYSPAEQMKRAEIFRRTKEIEASMQHRMPDWQQRMALWEGEASAGQPEWMVLRPTVDDISTGGERYSAQPDGSLLGLGYAPTKHNLKLTVDTGVQNITAFRLELLNDPDLPLGGPGRSIKGTGALTEFEVEAAPVGSKEKPVKIKFAKATADINLPEKPLDAIFYDKTDKKRVTGPIEFAIDGKEETAWGFDAGPGLRNQPRKAVFTAAAPVSNVGGTTLTFHVSQKHGGWNSDDNQNCNLGRFRLSITTQPDAVADPLPAKVREILSIASDKRSQAQEQAVFAYWRTTVPEWAEANEQIVALWREHPEGSSQLILAERETPRETHILGRGDFLRPGKSVTPGVPAFLHPLPKDEPVNRLTFARWLVDRNSPTTARSLVNRTWQNYFGMGLVSTTEDLGKQSETPSHPELLDWLAVEFMDRNWSMKAIHRLIVTSAVYKESSRITPEMYARDPYNRLLARGSRFRVDAEIVRDIALSASGLLNPEVGGPSIFAPAPEFLFQPPASYGPKIWTEAKGAKRYRRALYTFRYRSIPYPMLQVFDSPNGDVSCVRRSRSNTPLQALTTLNEPLFLESARALALRTIREGGKTDAQRVTYAVQRCLSRKPTERESTELLSLLNKQTLKFANGTGNPWELAANDATRPPAVPAGTTPAQLAAWTAVSRVLLNLDETITKE